MIMDYMELGKRVAARRRTMNLTQEKLAEKADISTGYVQNIERGLSKCSLEVLMRIGRVLDANPDYLISGAYKYVEESRLEQIKEAMLRCNPKQYELIVNFIAWVAEQRV